MKFQHYLLQQLNLHPCMQPQDIVKLCYQAAFGAEHLLQDIETAKKYFNNEYNSVAEQNMDLFEEISPFVCRINLAAWKASKMPSEWLFHMFLNTANIPQGGNDIFLQNLKTAEAVLIKTEVSFSFDEWHDYLNQYKESGIHAVHHSGIYRQKERPAYRIVHKRFLRLLPILQKSALLSHNEKAKIIAIDGRAASGKSTLADDLRLILHAGIVHMDDFFLPPDLRSKERYIEPGGNVHYERFAFEILPNLTDKESFSYTKFDCSIMDYNGTRLVKASEWRVVEGAYSCHPVFGNYADLKVFSDINPEEQMKRLIARNGAEMAERFRTQWIPMEEHYYNYYKIKEHADITISNEETV